MKTRIDILLIILAVIVIAAYGWMLHLHDARMEAAIETETEYSFNRGLFPQEGSNHGN